MTTPTLKPPHALPIETDRSPFLSGLSTETRKRPRRCSHILTAGLISFEELGAEGNPARSAAPTEAYQEALAAKKAAGLKHTAASVAVANQREQPEMVSAYNAERNEGRPLSGLRGTVLEFSWPANADLSAKQFYAVQLTHGREG
jgi:hypothetical protein